MKKCLKGVTKILAFTVLLFAVTNAVAQTVNITNIDPGPYGAGSSIAAKIALNNAAGCLQKTNKFNLYLSDAAGNFANEKLLGTYDGYGSGNGLYATFVNGIIPTTTLPGPGYRVRVKTTAPAATSAASDPFIINALPGVQAGISSGSTMDGYPEVFGKCVVSSSLKDTYNFQNTSTAGTTVSANFYNEQDRKDKGTQTFSSNFISFTADTSTYTVFVKATNGTTVGTKAYLLIENRGITTLSLVTAGPVCLGTTGASVVYVIDYQSPSGLQRNFPGTLYNINWGDGTSNDITICDIIASQGNLSHNYLKSSCGQKDGSTITNKFKVALTVKNPFCASSSSIYGQQPVLMPPSNLLSGPSFACTGNEVTFNNGSYPGQSATTTGNSCTDNSATYSYYVDGVLQATGLKLADKFKYTFTTHGQHTVVLHLENSASGCIPQDATVNLCVQDAPQPKFALSSTTVCTPTTVNVTDNSVIDNSCNGTFTYLWTVTPSTGFSYVGTNKNSKQPVFKFNTPGKYAIQLQITAPGGSCVAQTAVDYVYANSVPQIALSPDFATCGKNQTFRFSADAGKTHVTSTGTYQLQPDTYTWAVTPPAGGAPAIFANGTTPNSESPTITFPDFGKYVVTVVQKNGCGTSPVAIQNITFQNAPTVNAGNDATICANQAANLSATISDGALAGGAPTWSGGTASGFSDIHSYQTTYTPTSAEVNAGFVLLSITVPTTLQGDCSTVTDQVRIDIRPYNTITSAASRGICSGKPLSYQITSTLAGSTYTWTASGSANASGYTVSGSGDINETAITNSSPTENATVTYTITPHNNGCDGTPFIFTVTVVPQPVITAQGPAAICSGQKAGITLLSNVSNTTYTWTATTSDPANVTGISNVSTPATVTEIQDVLANTGSAAATVTYTITSFNSGSSDNCPGNTQTVTITIQPATPVANAGNDQSLCNSPTYQLNGNNLGPNGHGMWTLQSGQSGITFDDATKYNTTVRGLVANQDYTFRWTSTGASPCGDNFDDVVITNKFNDIKANFTTDKTTACDATAINFTNTSTPTSGVNYAWDFGNGQTSTVQNPQAVTFVPQANGKDTIYTVKLTVSNSCIIDSKSMNITIKPKTPVVQIAPDKTSGCVPFVVNVENLSPGTNDKYIYYLTDANGTVLSTKTRTDKDDQPFTINTVGTYKVYMQAQSQCGTAKSVTYTLVVSPATLTPRLTVNGGEDTGCGPLTVTFHNNTTGGSSFRYEWGDGTAPLTTTSTGDVNHTFAKGGNYTVTLHASNSCTPDVAAAPVTIHVLAQPVMAFMADNTSGCKKLNVQFSNTSTDPSVSQTADLKYDWDFGDGSPHSNAVNPSHHYGYIGSPFTVTLTATNGTGCTSTLVMKDMIRVNQSSLTDFTVKPDSVVNIPVYTFSFVDQTTGGPLTWHWDFGDGTTSNLKNPEHTYADTGRYKVTLTTANAYCDSTKSHFVRITGTPGQVYLPNAFMPNSATPDLRVYGAKGSGLKEWHLQILNNYGQVIYDTTDLDERGRPTGQWDGTFRGAPMPQGVYIWQATGKFINGNEWKGMSYNADGSGPRRSGVIHLLR